MPTLSCVDDLTRAGSELVAADVQYCFEQYAKEGVQAFTFQEIEAMETPDSHTLRVYLKTPNALFPQNVAEPVTDLRVLLEELGEPDGGRETRRARADNEDFCFHLLLSNPITPGEIPDVPALYAKPSGCQQRHCRDAERPNEHLRRAKLTQKIQQRQHDQCVHAKFVTKHAFHIHAGHSANGEIIDHKGAEVDAGTNW